MLFCVFLVENLNKFFKQGIREDEIDWWSKFYASTGDTEKSYRDSGLDLITVFFRELNYFSVNCF